jgi:hypothetical protein|tara:strand:- start:347 stop:589 length:243 start_codon:yes stop_codon:yes gene_type:complete
MSNKSYGDGFRYNLGDLVKFKVARHTEDYLSYIEKVGIVVEQSYRITKDNVFKIKVDDEYHWMPAPRITLLSKAEKAASK